MGSKGFVLDLRDFSLPLSTKELVGQFTQICLILEMKFGENFSWNP